MNEAGEVEEAPVTSDGKSAEIFETSEAPFDLVAMLDGGIVGDEYLAVPL